MAVKKVIKKASVVKAIRLNDVKAPIPTKDKQINPGWVKKDGRWVHLENELAIAKEIITYLLGKLPNETGKGIDRAKAFVA